MSTETDKKVVSKDAQRSIRIHVGGISKELASSLTDLENRFSKIGSIEKSFEIHEKPVLDYRFAYITMKLDKSGFSKLKKNWEGVRFKGSKLTIAVAKDDYQTLWKNDTKRQDTKILDRQKRELTAFNRKMRIAEANVNPFKLALVTKGRFRKTPRKTDLKNLTVRVNINGKLKIIKCKKSKLWGVDKNKKIKDLTYRFIAGEWRDGNDHVVDRLSDKVIVFDKGITVEDNDQNNEILADEVHQEFLEEQSRTNQLLANMLGKYDFDKPLDLEDDVGEVEAGYDYELDYNNNSEKEEEEEENDNGSEQVIVNYNNIPEKNCVHPSPEKLVEQYNNQSNVINFDEDKEEGDDFYSNLKSQNQKLEEACIVENNIDDDYDDEFIPTFMQTNSMVTNAQDEEKQQNSEDEEEEFIPKFGQAVANANGGNTTEKLRALLDTSNIADKEKPVNISLNHPNDIEILPSLKKTRDVGLFFSHFDSPFLVAQTQINKLRQVRISEELNYDEWFWNNRGELNREFRRLRRDVLRRNKKKTKTAVLI